MQEIISQCCTHKHTKKRGQANGRLPYEVRAWLTPAACSLCRWWPELQWRIRQRLWRVPSLSGGLRHVLRSWAGGSPGLAPGTWGRTTHPFYFLCFNRQRFSLFLPVRWRLWGLALWGEAGVIVVVQPPGKVAPGWGTGGLPTSKTVLPFAQLPPETWKARHTQSYARVFQLRLRAWKPQTAKSGFF